MITKSDSFVLYVRSGEIILPQGIPQRYIFLAPIHRSISQMIRVLLAFSVSTGNSTAHRRRSWGSRGT